MQATPGAKLLFLDLDDVAERRHVVQAVTAARSTRLTPSCRLATWTSGTRPRPISGPPAR
ncbi:MAG: hypothetical protein FJ029_09710 [Actinobacteria bacterium]|nr:hypothetical protein [Actinomycetota bacterium]